MRVDPLSKRSAYRKRAEEMLRARGEIEGPAALSECISELMVSAFFEGADCPADAVAGIIHYTKSVLNDIEHDIAKVRVTKAE